MTATVLDDIMVTLRREIREALRKRKLVDIIVDPWVKPHAAGAYVSIMRDRRGPSYTFEPRPMRKRRSR